jgi:DNA-binding IclR family transcriptional regulator
LIPEAVRKLIADHIDSVEQLEVLILLRSQRGRSWTVEEINDEIKSSTSSVEARLTALAARGLVERQGPTFRYQAAPEMDVTVTELAQAYAERRFTVIELIFAKPADKLRAFADAFKVNRKKGPDG